MAVIPVPGGVRRGPVTHSSLSYARYSRATWEWWCRRHGADFVPIEAPPQSHIFAEMPPTLQRWVAVDQAIAERGEDAQVIAVDADTMIRWDAPDIFELSRGFGAVIDVSRPDWIFFSLEHFQPLFPTVSIPWWEYFNSGLVVLGAAQRRVIRALLDYAATNWPALKASIGDGNWGTDQTLLNFIVRRENEPVSYLPHPFNLVNCFPMEGELLDMERTPPSDLALFSDKAFSRSWAFNFVGLGCVWHFTNVVNLRSVVMRETWLRTRHKYPGAICDEP